MTIVLLSLTSAHGQPPEDSGRAVRAAASEDGVKAALDDAIKRLKSGDVTGFIEFYFPVDDLRDAREGRLGKTFDSLRTPTSISALIKRLERARAVTPEINIGGFEATFMLPEEKTETKPVPRESPAVAPITKPLVGYDGNLEAALKQAIADLDDRKFERFVDRMFPRGELLHPQAAVRRAQLLSRLKQHPTMVDQMRLDLTVVLETEKPDTSSQQAVEITLKGNTVELPAGRRVRQMQLPNRTVRFERVGASWRFADQTTKLRESQEKVAAMGPASLSEFSASDRVVMERFGDRWRFLEF